MDLFTIVLIAVGLAMDAFAVSITCGFQLEPPRRFNALKIAFSFGFFQAFMPVLGWIAGRTLSGYIRAYDHWLAFGLLTIIGSRMLYAAIRSDVCKPIIDPGRFRILLGLSIATSIDALAVGITFAFLSVHIITPILIIGLVTFGVSIFGILMGYKLGYILGRKVEILGGLVLIGIGIKILIEHLT